MNHPSIHFKPNLMHPYDDELTTCTTRRAVYIPYSISIDYNYHLMPWIIANSKTFALKFIQKQVTGKFIFKKMSLFIPPTLWSIYFYILFILYVLCLSFIILWFILYFTFYVLLYIFIYIIYIIFLYILYLIYIIFLFLLQHLGRQWTIFLERNYFKLK